MDRTTITRRSIRLRIAVLAKGLGSYERLAQVTGIDRSRLSRIANEWIDPRPDEARRIAEAVGVGTADLFGDGNDNEAA